MTRTPGKKYEKTQAKLAKKQAKAELKLRKQTATVASDSRDDAKSEPSHAVRYAEIVRGVLYALTGTSLIVALVLGQRGAIISLDELIDGLFAAWAGKIVLALIGVALLIYGLKHLRLVR